ncbi:MAG: hypothetical protein SRB1_01306 [Desulfobacteraceae bacterium Eth-SRB1]|nr:MAG: hypothetical protein SRB1_01306 [Desulfobacteraceae bacterium Eth-SRB1]
MRWRKSAYLLYFDVFVHTIGQTNFFSSFHECGRFSEWIRGDSYWFNRCEQLVNFVRRSYGFLDCLNHFAVYSLVLNDVEVFAVVNRLELEMHVGI